MGVESYQGSQNLIQRFPKLVTSISCKDSPNGQRRPCGKTSRIGKTGTEADIAWAELVRTFLCLDESLSKHDRQPPFELMFLRPYDLHYKPTSHILSCFVLPCTSLQAASWPSTLMPRLPPLHGQLSDRRMILGIGGVIDVRPCYRRCK